MKLHDHFSVLYEAFRSIEVKAGLPALASALDCSERNVAVLLEKMVVAGWIKWAASRGRGHFSTLTFLLTPQQVRLQVLSDMLSAGDFERLVPTLDSIERGALASSLTDLFRRNYIDPDRRRLRVPLFRTVLSLDPAKAFLRVERHLTEQIFSRLTEFDHASNRLMPSLAHHWESNGDCTRWEFWIRPEIYCHDGSELTLDAIKNSILRVRDEPGIARKIFAHLDHVEICGPSQLAFNLTVPDLLWPDRLSSVNASIVPFACGEVFPDMPVGTGPFSVTHRSEERLTLGVFRNYYRERALLDEVDLWLMPPETEINFDLDFGSRAGDSILKQRLSKLFNGCLYLIFNPKQPYFADNRNRFALVELLATELIKPPFDRVCTPAHGILPGWRHNEAWPSGALSVEAGLVVRIASTPRPLPTLLAEVARRKLQALGVTVEVATIPDLDKQSPDRAWMDKTDIYICSEVLSENRDFGCYEWLAEDSDFRRWMRPAELQHLDRALMSVQQVPDRDERVRAYAEICKDLVANGSVIPLAHERVQVDAADHVGGISRIAHGFVPFADLWIRQDSVAAAVRSE